MFFRQVLHEDLGCASYVVADGGEAAVIDPKWDVEDYLRLAEEHGFAITHVLETHNHADHVSGKGRLAQATGRDHPRPGDGRGRIPARAAGRRRPGRSSATSRSPPSPRPAIGRSTRRTSSRTSRRGHEPWLVVTGDSLFVGDVARPDLAVDKEEGARGLYDSLKRLLALGDFAEVWPGHIGGSLCGGAGMSEKPGTTIGFERRFNRLLASKDEKTFVRSLTSSLAPQPPNFERIVALNRGPLLTDATPSTACCRRPSARGSRPAPRSSTGATRVEYDAGHVPGSINVTMVRAAVGTRAAWVVDPESEVAGRRRDGRRSPPASAPARGGRVPSDRAGSWRRGRSLARGRLPVESTVAIDVPELAARLRRGDVSLLDVRDQDEWEAGHVEGSRHLPYYDLRDGIPEDLRNGGKPLAVACSVGNRSSIAVSLLRRAGRRRRHPRRRRRGRRARRRRDRARSNRLSKPAALLHSAAQGGVAQLVRAAES